MSLLFSLSSASSSSLKRLPPLMKAWVHPSMSFQTANSKFLEKLGKDLTTREIAENLHLSPKTVETHRAHIKEKERGGHGSIRGGLGD